MIGTTSHKFYICAEAGSRCNLSNVVLIKQLLRENLIIEPVLVCVSEF